MEFEYIWLILCIVMIIIEIATVGNLVTIWFAIGAGCAYITSLFTDSLWAEFSVFIVVSLIALILMRPLAKKMLKGNVINTNADSLIGRQFRIHEAIEEQKWGSIKVNGSIWSATTVEREYIPENTLVEIIAIEGVKLIVRKIGE